MNNKQALAVFEDYKIRRVYDDKADLWYFSVVDIIAVLIQQPDYQAARNYWKVLKNRLKKEGSQTVTNCNRLKMTAEDGKMRHAAPRELRIQRAGGSDVVPAIYVLRHGHDADGPVRLRELDAAHGVHHRV